MINACDILMMLLEWMEKMVKKGLKKVVHRLTAQRTGLDMDEKMLEV